MGAMNAEATLAGTKVNEQQIQSWVKQFHRDGYLFLENVLPADWVRELNADLDRVLPTTGQPVEITMRLFEKSAANIRLFDVEPIVSFAEALIGEDASHGVQSCHVIHNNSFRTQKGGGLSTWHQDDSSHYVVTDGEPPKNVHLPVLFFTANYYLTDVTSLENGPGQVIPGSHLFGAKPPGDLTGTKWEKQIVSCLGKAGSVMMFNNQTWHRGAQNTSNTPRCLTQITYARRIIGHTYFPFMNYAMPEHVYKDANPRLKRLLGFKPSGAYG